MTASGRRVRIRQEPRSRLAKGLDIPLLVETPLAIRPEAIRPHAHFLEALAGFFELSAVTTEQRDGVAVLRVSGPLARLDYEDLRAAFDAALEDTAVVAVLLDVDSPGGTTPGLFDLADHLRAQRGSKPVWALASDHATSAAYAIAAQADRVFTTSTGIVGSIGVLALHVDQSALGEREGFKITEVASGSHKLDLSPHRPLGRDGLATLRMMVDKTAAELFRVVARGRGIKETAVRAQQAAVYVGADAIAARLVDGVATLDELVERLQTEGEAARARTAVNAQADAEIRELGAACRDHGVDVGLALELARERGHEEALRLVRTGAPELTLLAEQTYGRDSGPASGRPVGTADHGGRPAGAPKWGGCVKRATR